MSMAFNTLMMFCQVVMYFKWQNTCTTEAYVTQKEKKKKICLNEGSSGHITRALGAKKQNQKKTFLQHLVGAD